MSRRKTWFFRGERGSVSIEVGRPRFNLGVQCNEGSIVFCFFCFYLSFNLARLRKWTWDHDHYHLSVRIFDWAIWFELWSWDIAQSYEEDKSFWHREKRRFNWRPVDTFLGRDKHTMTRGEPQQIVVTMPEGPYFGTATPYRQRWKRPRWPFSKKRRGLDLDFPRGIPVPGKGTTSYNCDEDAIFGTGFETDDVDEAARLMAERVMETRIKYASSRWEPQLTVEQKLDKEHRIEYAIG